jgi:hypothetical protein
MEITTTAIGFALIAGGWAYHPTRDDLNSNMQTIGAEVLYTVSDNWKVSASAAKFKNSLNKNSSFTTFGGRYKLYEEGRLSVSILGGAGYIDYGKRNGSETFLTPVAAPEVCYWRICADATYIPSFRSDVEPAFYFQTKLKVF